jgi:hypothetical protein
LSAARTDRSGYIARIPIPLAPFDDGEVFVDAFADTPLNRSVRIHILDRGVEQIEDAVVVFSGQCRKERFRHISLRQPLPLEAALGESAVPVKVDSDLDQLAVVDLKHSVPC